MAKLEDSLALENLEEARAVLEAQLNGQSVEVDDSMVNAMSLIAQGYQSESEEEGEIEHEALKQNFIETQVKQLKEQYERQISEAGSGPSSVPGNIDNGDDDDDVIFVPSRTPSPVAVSKQSIKSRSPKPTKDRSRKSDSSRRRSRSPRRRSRSPRKNRTGSPVASRNKENRSPKREQDRHSPRRDNSTSEARHDFSR